MLERTMKKYLNKFGAKNPNSLNPVTPKALFVNPELQLHG